ncbi:membrane dipeptidase [Aquibacillus halophilus]|uniref:Membrane dipeptidase n=1 Tax=Aquibacillus halophilus TaxID=930132 RepID=A0A6A8DBG0_9BACI|nr:dipeptidase [Aquibacillus halophilus]MRH42640.1 membrane dipeptidase [Aquibacillus halophilus]
MIIDGHCDALLKLWSKNISFQSSSELQVNYEKWKASSVKIQCFAIFVPEDVPEEAQFKVALEMVDIFFKQIVEPYEDVKFISSKKDMLSLKENEKGAILTLEGCHPIGSDLYKLKTLIRLGVRSVGLTWNQANAVCDGIGEKRGAGLSTFGEEVIDLLNQEKIWTDVSHLSYQGFFDVMKIAKYPIASHSNTIAFSSHQRNLDDKQIQAMIDKDGWIGVTFVPPFLNDQDSTSVKDVINHLDYYLKKGAEDCLGLGSDFDGTIRFVEGLYDQLDYDSLINECRNYFSSEEIQKFSYLNFINKFPRV